MSTKTLQFDKWEHIPGSPGNTPETEVLKRTDQRTIKPEKTKYKMTIADQLKRLTKNMNTKQEIITATKTDSFDELVSEEALKSPKFAERLKLTQDERTKSINKVKESIKI